MEQLTSMPTRPDSDLMAVEASSSAGAAVDAGDGDVDAGDGNPHIDAASVEVDHSNYRERWRNCRQLLEACAAVADLLTLAFASAGASSVVGPAAVAVAGVGTSLSEAAAGSNAAPSGAEEGSSSIVDVAVDADDTPGAGVGAFLAELAASVWGYHMRDGVHRRRRELLLIRTFVEFVAAAVQRRSDGLVVAGASVGGYEEVAAGVVLQRSFGRAPFRDPGSHN